MLLLCRCVTTLSLMMLGFAPVIADVSESHILNHHWPGHARFHGVWLLAIGVSLAVIAIYMTWRRGSRPFRQLLLATVPGWIIALSFFFAAATMGLYQGTLKDDPTLPDVLGINGNLLLFSLASVLLLIATVTAARKSGEGKSRS